MKICVLCMSCNQEIFDYQEMVARNTWIKHLKDENIDVIIYKSGNNNIIDDVIYCNCEDDLKHTFEKTIIAFNHIIDKYDYIVRTNLTTYINAKILIKFCEYMYNNKIDIACGDICQKNNNYIYRGNSFIMTNEIMKYIINSKYNNKQMLHDDIAISEILFDTKYNVCIAPLRYYKDTIRKGHPYYLHNINIENLEGVVFISYRIYGEDKKPLYRYFELGLAYQIDSIYNKLENKTLKKDNFIYNLNQSKFVNL